MSAILNDTSGDHGVETTADERVVAALLAKGRLKDTDLARARRLQEETGGSLLSLLARLGLVSERDHAETAADRARPAAGQRQGRTGTAAGQHRCCRPSS